MNQLKVNQALTVFIRENESETTRQLKANIAELERASGFCIARCGHAAHYLFTCNCDLPICKECCLYCRHCQYRFCQECDFRQTMPCGCEFCFFCRVQRQVCACGSLLCWNHPHSQVTVYWPRFHQHCNQLQDCTVCQESIMFQRWVVIFVLCAAVINFLWF